MSHATQPQDAPECATCGALAAPYTSCINCDDPYPLRDLRPWALAAEIAACGLAVQAVRACHYYERDMNPKITRVDQDDPRWVAVDVQYNTQGWSALFGFDPGTGTLELWQD